VLEEDRREGRAPVPAGRRRGATGRRRARVGTRGGGSSWRVGRAEAEGADAGRCGRRRSAGEGAGERACSGAMLLVGLNLGQPREKKDWGGGI
jgi:hypothetical protein